MTSTCRAVIFPSLHAVLDLENPGVEIVVNIISSASCGACSAPGFACLEGQQASDMVSGHTVARAEATTNGRLPMNFSLFMEAGNITSQVAHDKVNTLCLAVEHQLTAFVYIGQCGAALQRGMLAGAWCSASTMTSASAKPFSISPRGPPHRRGPVKEVNIAFRPDLGASGSMAFSGSKTGSGSSYSTLILARASKAAFLAHCCHCCHRLPLIAGDLLGQHMVVRYHGKAIVGARPPA